MAVKLEKLCAACGGRCGELTEKAVGAAGAEMLIVIGAPCWEQLKQSDVVETR